jgi:ATP-dependent DNA helicase RecG
MARHLAFGRAYYRSGPATVVMTRDEYERRLLDRMRESSGFERRVEPAWADTEVDQDALHRFGERLALLGRLHLGRSGALTVAAILLFGRAPQGPLLQAVVRARARRGAAEDSAPIEGTLFDQIDRACDFVARNLKIRAVRTGVVRKDVPDLPLDAVREVIANAVAHRDYRSTAAIQLRLDDDGLVIWNPGHFPPPITPEALRREHPSVPTNPLLARALYLAGYIEEWGTGTLRVVEAMAKNGNPPPLFEERDGGVRVALPLTGALPADLLPRERAFTAGGPRGRFDGRRALGP